MDSEMIKKSIILWKNTPKETVASPTSQINDWVKSIPPVKIPTSGIIILSTREETIFPKAVPMTTATAKSMTLPLTANSLYRVQGNADATSYIWLSADL